MTVHVLHVVKTARGATWAFRQIRELIQLGVRVTVVVPPDVDGAGPRYSEVGAQVVREDFSLPVGRPWELPKKLARVRKVVEDTAPDVIHSHFVTCTYLLRLALGREHPTPRVFQVPGPLHLEQGPFGRAELAMAGPRDHWIGTCQWTRGRYLSLGVPSSRVHLSYYGADTQNFGSRRSGVLRQELGIDEMVPLVGMVAYIYAPKFYLGQRVGLKGHEDFLEAFSIARKRIPRLRAVIIGNGWTSVARKYEKILRAAAWLRCGDSCSFLGYRNDVPQIYPDLDVVAHPSLSENVGGAVESLLSGVPTVASRVGGFPDVVRDGVTGWLVPPRDPARLAEALVEAVEEREKARQRAAAGRELVRTLFDVRRTAGEVADLYHLMLGTDQERGFHRARAWGT